MTELRLLNTLSNGQFMQPVIYAGRFFEVETNHGSEYVDQDLIGLTAYPEHREFFDYIDGSQVYEYRLIDGYGAYLSAPGYMDRTELCVFASEQNAINYLIEYYEA
jgi:hypothetical protein